MVKVMTEFDLITTLWPKPKLRTKVWSWLSS